MKIPTTGSCQCGSVHYEVTGAPVPETQPDSGAFVKASGARGAESGG